MTTKKPFMRDGESLLTYGGLLDFVNSAETYRPLLKPENLFDFLKNFILAMATGKDLCLLDQSASQTEAEALGAGGIARAAPIGSKAKFESAAGLIEAVKNSPSKVSLFTSGTSGLPKKVSHCIRSLTRHTRVSPDKSGDVWGFAYSPTHMAGIQVLLQTFLNQNSAANLFMKPKGFVFESVEKFGITHISASPTFYRLLLPANKKYPGVRRITLGGEKSNAKLYAAISETFPNAKINNIYASTECGSLLASSGEFFRIPANLEGLVKIENGELLVHKKLLGDFESANADGDFYKTGDLVEWAGGQKYEFKFVSRKSSLVNVGGYKVNIEEVEEAIAAMPGVAQAAVYGRKNSVLGNVLCADIRLEAGAGADVAAVRGFLAKRLQAFKIPRKIQFVESIQTTESGKVKRQ